MQLLRLVASQVKVGVPLPFGVRDEHGNLLLARGQVVVTDRQLEALLERGLFADVEEVKAALAAAGKGAEPERKRLTLFDLWDQSALRLDRLLKGMLDSPGFEQRCDEFATQFIGLVKRDPDIAIYVSVRQDERRMNLYGLSHCLHTAMVCQLMATRMGWADDRLQRIVKVALTMNLSIVDLQGQLAAQGRISESQRAQIRAHPQAAAERLRAAGVADSEWLDAVLQHHERAGGGGYPNDLFDPTDLSGAVRLADVFMAKISTRAERPALSIQEAARQMFGESRGSPAAAAIIKEYGIYPPGNFLRLASGELAVVIRRGATAHTPLVAAITDKSGMPMVKTVRRDTAQAPFAIAALASDKTMMQRLAPERLYGLVEEA